MAIKFPESVKKYVKLQCNGDFSCFTDSPEIKFVEKHFKNVSPKNVLELGCGLGRVSVAFYKAFSFWKATNYWLFDGNSGDKQVAGINYEAHKSFYNSLKQTEEFCLTNGMRQQQIHILNAEKPDVFSLINVKFDFVYSFYALGFHWPFSLYLQKIDLFLKSGTILYFGIRPNNKKEFREYNDYQVGKISLEKFHLLEIVTNKENGNHIILERK